MGMYTTSKSPFTTTNGLGDVEGFLEGSGTMLAIGLGVFFWWALSGPYKEKRRELARAKRDYQARKKQIQGEYGWLGVRGGPRGAKTRKRARQKRDAIEGGYWAGND